MCYFSNLWETVIPAFSSPILEDLEPAFAASTKTWANITKVSQWVSHSSTHQNHQLVKGQIAETHAESFQFGGIYTSEKFSADANDASPWLLPHHHMCFQLVLKPQAWC